jgi:pimeloyl-ACP methyl ester carboxylesterase
MPIARRGAGAHRSGPPGGAAPLPTVLWLHGLGADKELAPARPAALCRGRPVGDRRRCGGSRAATAKPDFEQQFARPPAQRERLFNTLVAQTVAELPGLLDALVDGGLSDPQRLAVAGVSMGGCITYGAASRDRRLRAAVALLGSPAWIVCAAGADAVPRRASTRRRLLSITAENDCVVPPSSGTRPCTKQLASSLRRRTRSGWLTGSLLAPRTS